MGLVILWTLSALFGAVASGWNLKERLLDYRVIDDPNGRRYLARQRIRREVFRLVAQLSWFIVGLVALFGESHPTFNPVLALLVLTNVILFLDSLLAAREDATLRVLLARYHPRPVEAATNGDSS